MNLMKIMMIMRRKCMIKYALKKWDKNKDALRNAIQQTEKDKRSTWDYNDIVKLVCHYIFNENTTDKDPKINIEGITMIDNGGYQGTLLFMMPFDTYQPMEYEYLMTYVGYGSCSGCDTLQRIQLDELYYNVNSTDDLIDSYMALCKDIVSNTIRPYNTGWRNDMIFEPVNSSSSEDSITCIKMITKGTLYDIMRSWLKPIIDNVESLGGYWNFGSSAGGFGWILHSGVGIRHRSIGARLCYDNEKAIVGYDIYTNYSKNVNIKIRENSIEFIEDSNFQGFSKEEIEDLYYKITNHMFNCGVLNEEDIK